MSTVSARFSTVAHSLTSAATKTDAHPHILSDYLSKLYVLSQRSDYVFASPIGPFYHRALHLSLPRFVYFGPHTHDESLRLAFLTGFNHQDLRGSLALLQFIEHLVLKPDLGHGLNLSLFPLLDVAGLYHGVQNRHLETENWNHPKAPEIELLGKDARTRGYHGFVRIETAASGSDEITVSLRGIDEASGVELISSEDFDPLPVRWEADAFDTAPTNGPLTLADDLPFRPFELTLRVPAGWPTDLHSTVVSSILKRFVLRYRALQAHSNGI
jgi:hypothetical protein